MIGDTARQRTVRRARLLLTVLLASAAAALLGGSPAHAVRDCEYDTDTEVVTITITGSDTSVVIGRTAGGTLTVSGTGVIDTCDNVSLGSIARIDVDTETTGGGADTSSQTVTIELENGLFTPGNSLESGTSSVPEIEFDVDLGGGAGDKLVVTGSSGTDRFTMGASGINLNSDEGAPQDADITPLAGVETVELQGLDGDDVITAAGGAGTGGVNTTGVTIAGGNGADTLTGGDGADTFDEGTAASSTPNGADIIEGGLGTDTVTYSGRSSAVSISVDNVANDGAVGVNETDNVDVENLTGGEGADTLSGTRSDLAGVHSSVDNVFLGGDNSGTGAGDGGDGSDTVTYAARSVPFVITVNGSATTTADATETDTVGANIENVTGGSGNDTINGDGDANLLDGGPGNDKLVANAGSDTLIGGLGDDDQLDGGTEPATGGADILDYSGSTAVTVSLGNGTNGTATGVGSDSGIADIEKVIGSSQGDSITGDGSANELAGGDGNDTLRGGGGNDTLIGGNGADNLSGEAGDDTHTGGTDSATDILDFAGRPQVTVTFTGAGAGTTTGDDDAAAGNDGFTEIETVHGSSNNDTFISSASADSFDGKDGADEANYTATGTPAVVVNLATGTATGHGNDVFTNVENAKGGGGNDRFVSSSGDNVITGGAGSDTADYSAATAVVTVNLSTTTQQPTGGGGNDTLTQIENLIGSDVNDRDHLTGDGNANTLDGRAGDDTIEGGAGNDTLIGGNGDDDFSGQGGADDVLDYSGAVNSMSVNLTTLTASGQGADEFVGIENVIGSPQADVIIGDGEANELSGGGSNDELRGGDNVDTLNGENGDDTLRSGDGGTVLAHETLDGGAGSDTADYADAPATSGSTGLTIDMTASPPSITGHAAFDDYTNVENVTGSAFDDTITGNDNANVLSGLAGVDVLKGRLGNDTLAGGLGNDTLNGGHESTATGDAGLDTVDYTNSLTAVTIDLGAPSATGEGTDTLMSIENATGSTLNDTLTGSTGDNVLKGNAGDDTLKGLAGNDTLDGDVGNDKADYSGATAVTVDLDVSAAQATGVGNDTLSELEKLLGSDGNDTLLGDENVNEIVGGNGDDTINGRTGDDTLTGGAGANTVSYAGAPGSVTIDLPAGTATGVGASTDTLSGFVNVVGSSHDDIVIGTVGDNVVDGGDGSDTISYANATSSATVNLSDSAQQATGGAGNDTLANLEGVIGSTFDDTFMGTSGDNLVTGGGHGSTGDTVSYANASAGVRVDLSEATAQDTQGAGTDTITQIENVVGSGSQDTLIGDAGSNTLTGGNGDDTLNGAGGNDTENGGAGNDLFDQGTTPNGSDVMIGGSNSTDGDVVDYSKRGTIAFVSFDGIANDGESGEADNVGSDVERSTLATFAPTAPTNVTATAGNELATVTWTAPTNNGGAAITGYTVTSNPGNKQAHTGAGTLSATVTGLTNGTTYTFTVTATNSAGTGTQSAPSNAVTPSDPTKGQGYALLGNDGGVFSFGAAGNFGSIPGLGLTLNQPPIGMAYTPTGKGYWIVAQDGGIFSFGDAKFFGSMGNVTLNSPVLGMEPTPTGKGYWLFAGDGGIFSFGDATFFGSMGASKLNAPVIGMAATSTGKGYWLVAQDGGIFSFGDAKFFGSMGASKLNQPVFDMAPAADNAGYYLVARDGGIFSFGSAANKFFGSAANSNPATVIGIGTTPGGNGYWIADQRGVVYAFGDAGALGDLRGAGKTVVGFAALPKQT